MKKTARSFLAAMLVFVIVFFTLTGLKQFVLDQQTVWSWLQFVAPAFQVLDNTVLLAFSVCSGLLAFLLGIFSHQRAAKTAFSVIFLTGCIGWFLFQVPQLQETLRERTGEIIADRVGETAAADVVYEDAVQYSSDDLPLIQVLSTERKSQEWVNWVTTYAIEAMPQELLEKCSTIIFMDEEHFAQEEMNENLSNVVGLANSADMSVKVLIQDFDTQYIDKSMPEWIMDPIDYYINTISHELGHIYDYQYAYNQTFYSDEEEFQKLYELCKDDLNDYASSNAHEFFAEGTKLYFFYSSYLQEKSPSAWAYFDQLYQAQE